MTEAERLSGIVKNQAKEIRRLRTMLKQVRICGIEISVEDGKRAQVAVTAIGCDEFTFIQEARKEITALASLLLGGPVKDVDARDVTDSISGEPQIDGGGGSTAGDEGLK